MYVITLHANFQIHELVDVGVRDWLELRQEYSQGVANSLVQHEIKPPTVDRGELESNSYVIYKQFLGNDKVYLENPKYFLSNVLVKTK